MDLFAMLEETIRQDARRIGKALLVLIGAFAVLALAVIAANAHQAPTGWSYPPLCCSTTDCREVNDASVIEDARGYRIKATGEMIPNGSTKIKPSPDGKFHWCSRLGLPDSDTICLFVPPRGM